MINIDPEIVAIFTEEAADILSSWERECLNLETNMDDPDFSALFRCAHNIKGSSKSVGLEELGNFVHEVEDIINFLRNGQMDLTPELITYLLDAQAILVEWVEGLESDPTYKVDVEQLLDQTKKIKDKREPDASSEEEEEQEPKDFGTIAIEEGLASEEEIAQAAQLQNRKIGEIMVEQGMLKPKTKEIILEKQAKQIIKKKGTDKVDETIRVSAQRIDHLIQLIGELSIHQSTITQSKKNDTMDGYSCQSAIGFASKINSEIQSHALSLRMTPLESLFNRCEKIISDLAKNQKKEINIVLEGSTVELDKTIIEKITDPLIHIIRNAVDHGIEDSDIRAEKNKPVAATVTLMAQQDATGVIVTIKDDGKGLDAGKIKQKAIEKGIISPDAQLPNSEIFSLIFEPGFSMAEKVTDVSGRGVGMDVVRRSVDSVNGIIDIDSKIDHGSIFSISLPTSLSIIDALIVKLESNRYIIPLLEIAEIIDLSSYKLDRTSTGENMINLRGKVVPVQILTDYFPQHLAESEEIQTDNDDSNLNPSDRPALILQLGQAKIAFEVDQIIGQQPVVVRPLNRKLNSIPGYSGGSIMADGEAGMILTLKQVAQQYIEQHRGPANFKETSD